MPINGHHFDQIPDLIKPSFRVLGTFQSSCDTRSHSKSAPGDVEVPTHSNSFYSVFLSHKRTDPVTTDSRIATSTTMWRSFSCFLCTVHILRPSFCAPRSFLIPKTKKNASHGIMESPHHSYTHFKMFF